jgi:hypothetical protein
MKKVKLHIKAFKKLQMEVQNEGWLTFLSRLLTNNVHGGHSNLQV